MRPLGHRFSNCGRLHQFSHLVHFYKFKSTVLTFDVQKQCFYCIFIYLFNVSSPLLPSPNIVLSDSFHILFFFFSDFKIKYSGGRSLKVFFFLSKCGITIKTLRSIAAREPQFNCSVSFCGPFLFSFHSLQKFADQLRPCSLELLYINQCALMGRSKGGI